MNKEENKNRYIIYCRKSTDSEDRQIQSIKDQRNELKKLVNEKGLNVVKIFEESKSAKKPGRPEFNEMMNIIQSGKADGIICWKLNRLSRNPIDGGLIQWLLQRGVIKSIMTVGREYLSADNVLIMGVEFGVANQYIIDLSKDVKRGMVAKAVKGWRPHTAPLGYLNDKYGDKGEKKIFRDPDRFHIVRKMWDYLLTGNYSVPQVIKIANDEWGLRSIQRKGKGPMKISMSTGCKIFNNPFYFGLFEFNGEVYQGRHDPMITQEEFDRVQKILGRDGKSRPKIKRLPFNGLIICGECGGMITSEEKFKKNKTNDKVRHYIYHHCTKNKKGVSCNQKCIRHEDLCEQVSSFIDKITIPPEFLHWGVSVLREQHELEQNDRDVLLENQQKNYKSCVGSLDNLMRLYISPENMDRKLISNDLFISQKDTLMKERARLEGVIKNLEERMDEWMELAERTFNFATYAKYWFEKADFEQKTILLRALGQHFILKNNRLDIEIKKPFLTIKEATENKEIKSIASEPVNFALLQRKNSHFQTVFSSWSG